MREGDMKGHNIPKIIGKKIGNKFVGENRVVKRQSTQLGETSSKTESTIELPKIDLFKVSVKNLERKIQRNLNSGKPSDFLFIWSGERKLRKEEMDVQHQSIILSQIQSLREMGSEIAELQADRVFNGGLLNCILEKRKADADFALAQRKYEFHSLASDMIDRSLQHQEKLSEINRANKESDAKIYTDKLIAEAQVELIKAQAGEITARAGKDNRINDFLQYIMDNELSKFSDSAMVIITALAMGQSAKEIADLEQSKMFEPFLNRMKESEAKKEEQRARQEEKNTERMEHENRNTRYQADMTKKQRDDELKKNVPS